MIELAPIIYQQINNAHQYATYQGRANDKATYPYVVYKLFPLEPGKDREDYRLEVSCWDKSPSTSHAAVMRLAGDVRNALNMYRHNAPYGQINTTTPAVGYIPDPDAEIKRYDVTCNIYTYRRTVQ